MKTGEKPQNNQKKELVLLGGCRSPHGIKGGFSCFLFNTQNSVLQPGISVVLTPENDKSTVSPQGEVVKIKKISIGGKEHKATLYLEGVNDRNQSEAMIPFSISVERSVFPVIENSDNSEFYIVDLLNCQVKTSGSSHPIGTIVDYYQLDNSSIVFTIRKADDNEEFDLPFTEHFFPKIDLEQKLVEIILPEIIEDEREKR